MEKENKIIEEDKTNFAKESKPKKKKSKIIILIAIIFLFVVGVIISIFIYCNSPSVLYNKAVVLMNDNSYAQAIEIFEKNIDYNDSADLIDMCNYELAIELLYEGNYSDADILLATINNDDLLGNIKEEMIYESYTAQVVSDLMSDLTNSSSLSIHDVAFYVATDGYLVCILEYSYTNITGSEVRQYVYANNNNPYELFTCCYTTAAPLVSGNTNTSQEAFSYLIISAFVQCGDEVGSFDFDRVKNFTELSSLFDVETFTSLII